MRRALVLFTIFTFGTVAAPALAQDDGIRLAPPGQEERSARQLSTPESFIKLVEHPDTLELTNISDRPVAAWMVRTVTRSRQGFEARTESGVDAIRDELLPAGATRGALLPGASVKIEKVKPWLREDHRGPGSSVRHYVGLVVLEDDQAFGDADLIERLFDRRRAMVREAAAALDALERDPRQIRDFPMYRDVFDHVPDQEEALAEIRRRAREDYQLTVSHLRPQDLAILERERAQQRERNRR